MSGTAMSGTERGEDGNRHTAACRSLSCPCYVDGLAAALAEHEGCAGCARVEALAAAREARAEVAALRTEREEAVRLLREVGGGPHSLSMCPWPLRQEVTAFLARTDTGGQEP